jgi:hypothetical protein
MQQITKYYEVLIKHLSQIWARYLDKQQTYVNAKGKHLDNQQFAQYPTTPLPSSSYY